MDPNSISFSQGLSGPIGALLEQAALLSSAQIQVVMQDQAYCGMRFGEILVVRGWIKQETADFFAEQWPVMIRQPAKILIGECLQQAGLLSRDQVEQAIREQCNNGLRIGAIWVLKGWLKQPTVDFFIMGLAPERIKDSPFTNQFSTPNRPMPLPRGSQRLTNPSALSHFLDLEGIASEDIDLDDDLDDEKSQSPEEEEIHWLG